MKLTFNTTDQYGFDSIVAFVDGKEAGYLTVNKTDDYDIEIRYVEIHEEFQRLGLFVKMIKAVFTFDKYEDCDTLTSFHRFEDTGNAIYSHWLGEEVKTTDKISWNWDKWDEVLTLTYKDKEIVK